jgi:replication-associated recombination protein RarA
MSHQEKQKRKADELLHQSLISKSNGDLESALQLLNQVISLAQKEGLKTYPY